MLTLIPRPEKTVENITAPFPADTVTVRGFDSDWFEPFYKRNWTDGLPIIPPTRKRVETFLNAISHPPDKIIGTLPPRGGIATVERVTINSVMAGCRPEYLPIILAAVEAIAEPDNNMAGWATTTGHNSPLLIINGPIRDELNINYGTNSLGTGRRANATIGRAINLITRNIGGSIPRISDMTTIGGAWEYTSCLGENEDSLPHGWAPLNSELGMPGANTVTVKAINSHVDIFFHSALEFRQVLDTTAASITGINCMGILQGHGVVFCLCPEAADLAARDNWSKEDIKQYLFENARQPLKDWKRLGDNIVASEMMPESMIESDDYLMRSIPDPEDIIIFVAGGPGKHSDWWPGGHGRAVIKSIDKWR